MTIAELLRSSKTVAVVGISDDMTRPSSEVAMQLMRRGFTVIPVNPRLKEWNGLKCYAYVADIPEEIDIDIVDVFRRSEFTPDTVRDALKRRNKPRCIWLQQGIVNEESKALAERAGVYFVEDLCTAVEAALNRVTIH